MGNHRKNIARRFMLILLLSLFTTWHTVHAGSIFADGEYTLPFQVWQETNDELSATSEYIDNTANLSIVEGNMQVTVTLNNSSWWQSFDILSSSGEYEPVTVLSEDADNDTRRVTFAVDDLERPLQAHIHIIVTGIPGFVYDNTYDIRLVFDGSQLPLLAEEQDAEVPNLMPDPPKEPSVKDDVNLGEGSSKGTVDGGHDGGSKDTTEVENNAGAAEEAERQDAIDLVHDTESQQLGEPEGDADGLLENDSENLDPVQSENEPEASEMADHEPLQDDSTSNHLTRTLTLIVIALGILTVAVIIYVRKRK